MNKLSHEIRSTMQGLLGYILIFSDEVKPRLNPDEVHLLERINYFANELSNLVAELLSDLES